MQFRCKIEGCNSTGYDGYIWEDSEKTESCEYYEAVPDQAGMCVRANGSVIRSCKDGPYIFEDFEFDRTTITQFNVLCEDGFIEGFFISVSIKVLTCCC